LPTPPHTPRPTPRPTHALGPRPRPRLLPRPTRWGFSLPTPRPRATPPTTTCEAVPGLGGRLDPSAVPETGTGGGVLRIHFHLVKMNCEPTTCGAVPGLGGHLALSPLALSPLALSPLALSPRLLIIHPPQFAFFSYTEITETAAPPAFPPPGVCVGEADFYCQ
jgi:hypothetical protein